MPPSLSLAERILHRLHLLPTPVMDAFGAVIFARALTVGLRRGMFESVALRPMSLQELSRETGLGAGGVRLLADAFVAGGYVTRRNGMYSAGAEAKKWLVRDSRTYLGDLILYFDSLNTRLPGLDYSLEHGKPREPYYASFTDGDWETYVRGMANLARLLLPEVMRRIRIPASGAHVLDLGGSHALYARECCRRYSACTAIVMDFPQALRVAAATEDAALKGRIRLVAGDILTTPFPGNQDAVFLFNIVHGFDEEQNRSLIVRAAASLREGGKLYVLDQLTGAGGGSLLSSFMPLMVGLNLMNEIGGSAYSAADIRAWCADAAAFRVMPLRFPGVSLIEATGWRLTTASERID